MMESPNFWAERLRVSTTDCARVFARRALATSIFKLAADTMRAKGVPADAAEFEANYLAFELGRRIEESGVQAGSENAYVRRCAQNRANDHFRGTSGVRATCELRDEDEELADERTPEGHLAESEEAAIIASRVRRLRELIATAPEAHRVMLEEVYVRGTLIEVVAKRLMAERIARGLERAQDVHALRRARATVDQRLKRARDWIRARMGCR